MIRGFGGKCVIGGEWLFRGYETSCGMDWSYRGEAVYSIDLFDPKTRSEINLRTNDPSMIIAVPAERGELPWIKIEDKQPECEKIKNNLRSKPLEFKDAHGNVYQGFFSGTCGWNAFYATNNYPDATGKSEDVYRTSLSSGLDKNRPLATHWRLIQEQPATNVLDKSPKIPDWCVGFSGPVRFKKQDRSGDFVNPVFTFVGMKLGTDLALVKHWENEFYVSVNDIEPAPSIIQTQETTMSQNTSNDAIQIDDWVECIHPLDGRLTEGKLYKVTNTRNTDTGNFLILTDDSGVTDGGWQVVRFKKVQSPVQEPSKSDEIEVDDWVECVDPFEGRMTKGKLYKVTKAEPPPYEYLTVTDDSGMRDGEWFIKRFKKVPNPPVDTATNTTKTEEVAMSEVKVPEGFTSVHDGRPDASRPFEYIDELGRRSVGFMTNQGNFVHPDNRCGNLASSTKEDALFAATPWTSTWSDSDRVKAVAWRYTDTQENKKVIQHLDIDGNKLEVGDRVEVVEGNGVSLPAGRKYKVGKLASNGLTIHLESTQDWWNSTRFRKIVEPKIPAGFTRVEDGLPPRPKLGGAEHGTKVDFVDSDGKVRTGHYACTGVFCDHDHADRGYHNDAYCRSHETMPAFQHITKHAIAWRLKEEPKEVPSMFVPPDFTRSTTLPDDPKTDKIPVIVIDDKGNKFPAIYSKSHKFFHERGDVGFHPEKWLRSHKSKGYPYITRSVFAWVYDPEAKPTEPDMSHRHTVTFDMIRASERKPEPNTPIYFNSDIGVCLGHLTDRGEYWGSPLSISCGGVRLDKIDYWLPAHHGFHSLIPKPPGLTAKVVAMDEYTSLSQPLKMDAEGSLSEPTEFIEKGRFLVDTSKRPLVTPQRLLLTGSGLLALSKILHWL